MKKIYYIYVCLGVLLLTALPAKAASEAEFGKLAKTDRNRYLIFSAAV